METEVKTKVKRSCNSLSNTMPVFMMLLYKGGKPLPLPE